MWMWATPSRAYPHGRSPGAPCLPIRSLSLCLLTSRCRVGWWNGSKGWIRPSRVGHAKRVQDGAEIGCVANDATMMW